MCQILSSTLLINNAFYFLVLVNILSTNDYQTQFAKTAFCFYINFVIK